MSRSRKAEITGSTIVWIPPDLISFEIVMVLIKQLLASRCWHTIGTEDRLLALLAARAVEHYQLVAQHKHSHRQSASQPAS
jgi:hypothetical protein